MQNYNNNSKKAKCPVCNNYEANILWTVDSHQAAQHFVLLELYPEKFEELVSHIEFLWEQNTCDVVQCDKCGFCYSDPYIAGDKKFYDLAYIGTEYPIWKWEFHLTYDALKTLSKSDAKLLEIGAGDGAFVKRIADEIVSKENILCSEFSRYGMRKIRKLGVECFFKDIRDLSDEKWKDSFDIVCAFQVLEHMDRIGVLFEKLNWIMKPDGNLFIAVPNQKRIEFNELNGGLLDMPPNHIGRWNKQSFIIIAEKNGFQLKDYRIERSSVISMVKQFVIYRFLRSAQQGNSLENKIQIIRIPYLRKGMQIVGLIINFIIAIPVLTKFNYQLGSSQWVHLIKEKE